MSASVSWYSSPWAKEWPVKSIPVLLREARELRLAMVLILPALEPASLAAAAPSILLSSAVAPPSGAAAEASPSAPSSPSAASGGMGLAEAREAYRSLMRRFSFCLMSSTDTNGMVVPSGALTKILVGKAPLFTILRYWVFCSPKITFPKSILGVSTSIRAFLQVQIRGISILPVSLRIGKTEWMSSLS